MPYPRAEFDDQMLLPRNRYSNVWCTLLKSVFFINTFENTAKFVETLFAEPTHKSDIFPFNLTNPWIRNQVYSARQEERCKLDTSGSNSPPHPDKVQASYPLEGPTRQMPQSSDTEKDEMPGYARDGRDVKVLNWSAHYIFQKQLRAIVLLLRELCRQCRHAVQWVSVWNFSNPLSPQRPKYWPSKISELAP